MKGRINPKKYIKLLSPYVNKWIAVNNDETEVLVSGKSIIDVENRLEKEKKQASHIMFVLPFNRQYAPYTYEKTKREGISISFMDIL